MPQGSDFLCANQQCKNFGKRITIHGSWPLKSIDEAIAKATGEDKEILEKRKTDGRRFSLFVFPEDKGKSPLGWRTQLYCEKDLIVFDKEFDTKEEAENISVSPPVCERCGGESKSLKKAVSVGISCPTCGKRMNPMHWFTK